ncbi:MAG TPA: hypothetical protein DHV00_03010 [Alteromonas macleodii]|nr:hypothetical protein [Alteromonas macleodii]|tara:strand:- start:109 stop:717 length:609 start_codon:yes stop_codon:yes gene_type:complete
MTLSVENELMSLKASLETADEVVEKTLIAYDKNDYEYETLKHEAFAELNQVIIDLKSLVRQIEPDLNMRPIERILEEFRNVNNGSPNVLLMHKNPKLENIEGRPKTADKNEYLALVFAAVNISRGSERSIEEHISKVAKDTGLSKKEIKNIRTRFLRKGRVSTEYRDLAFRFSNAPKDYDKDQWYKNLINKFNSLKRNWQKP